MRVLNGQLLLPMLVWVSQVHAFSYVTDRRAAMIVTQSTISELNQGRVLGYFPNVLFSHDELKTSTGLMLLESVKNKAGSSLPTILEGTAHTFNNAVFLAKLRELVGESNLPTSFVFYDEPGQASEFGDGARWFVLEKERKAAAQLPSDSIAMRLEEEIRRNSPQGENMPKAYQPVMTSILIELGPEDAIRRKNDAYARTEGRDIFSSHFTSIPLSMEVFESRPGVSKSDEPVVGALEAFDLRFHNRDLSGQVIVPDGVNGGVLTIPVCRVTRVGKGHLVTINATEYLKLAAKPSLENADKIPDLECVVPDAGRESLTACREAPSDPCGPQVIEGYLGSAEDLAGASLPAEFRNRRQLFETQASDGHITAILKPMGDIDPTLQYRLTLTYPFQEQRTLK